MRPRTMSRQSLVPSHSEGPAWRDKRHSGHRRVRREDSGNDVSSLSSSTDAAGMNNGCSLLSSISLPCWLDSAVAAAMAAATSPGCRITTGSPERSHGLAWRSGPPAWRCDAKTLAATPLPNGRNCPAGAAHAPAAETRLQKAPAHQPRTPLLNGPAHPALPPPSTGPAPS